MKKGLFVVFTLFLLAASSTNFAFPYWNNISGIKNDSKSVQIGSWGAVVPPYVPGTSYPSGAFIEYLGAHYYNATGAVLNNDPSGGGWTYVPSYDEVKNVAQWNAATLYDSKYTGMIFEYQGEYYKFVGTYVDRGIPPTDPNYNWAWERILNFQDTTAPMAWKAGDYDKPPFEPKIFSYGGEHYALVIPRNRYNTDTPNANANTQHFRKILQWSPSLTFTNFLKPGVPYESVNEMYHCYTIENGVKVFWELRDNRTNPTNSISGNNTAPGSYQYWQRYVFKCFESVVVTETAGEKTVWELSVSAPTVISPLDANQTIWHKRTFTQTSVLYVYTIVGGAAVLWRNTVTIGANSSIPGADNNWVRLN